MSVFDAPETWPEFLARIRPELASYPESLSGAPNRDRVSAGYRTDPVHGEYATLTAFEPHVNDERQLVAVSFEVAPGVVAELNDLRVYLQND
jgi:hypothetical protein